MSERLKELKDSSSRSQSLASSSILNEYRDRQDVDLNELYLAVLKLIVIEYRNEGRFRKPIPSSSGSNKSTTSNSTSSSHSKYYRNSKTAEDSDVKLPAYLIPSLEKRLNKITMKKSDKNIDEDTRRSLLRLYSELLDPTLRAEYMNVNKPEYLVMKFVSCANKELVKIGTVPMNEVSYTVFKQADTFVKILIELIRKDKDSDAIIAKLQENKEILEPSVKLKRRSAPSSSSLVDDSALSASFVQPSFQVSDMDQTIVGLISELFKIDHDTIQQDVKKISNISQEKTLHKDLDQVLFYLDKDMGKYRRKDFSSEASYEAWKEREKDSCQYIKNKYPIPAASRLISIPDLPQNEKYYVLPNESSIRPYLITLSKLCWDREKDTRKTIASTDDGSVIISKPAINLLNTCFKFWKTDHPTRITFLFLGAHLSGILKDKLSIESETKSSGPIDLDATLGVLSLCRKIMDDGRLSFYNKHEWSISDQEEWTNCLILSYNDVLYTFKEFLSMIFSKRAKPRFGPYLAFLGEHIEQDILFSNVQSSGITKKWEKRLSKSLLRGTELYYSDLLSDLPRDDTLNILHIIEIAETIVDQIKSLQRKYKNPFLGFLDVPRTVAAVLTSMFAADAKNIFLHIETYANNRNEFLPYGDCLECYKSLCEIRSIFYQVSTRGTTFKFNLEEFFFKYLRSWVDESGEKIMQIVKEAIKNDKFEPINLDEDSKKCSSSVLDIVTLIKEFLKILNGLKWQNEYQLAVSSTSLLKSISDGLLLFSNSFADKITRDLNEEELKRQQIEEQNRKNENRKSGSWFNDVKNVVSSIHNSTKLEIEEPYNFKSETCVALNNISAMMNQLTKLEELLDPQSISAMMRKHDPSSQTKYTSHIFTLRIVRAENLKMTGSSFPNPYVTLVDTKARKTVGRTRVINNKADPEWDEEFEITLSPHSSLTLSTTVWNQKLGTHAVCGRALIQLDPRRFKSDGVPNEIYLDLDSQGRLLIEVAVESEKLDAMFVMGRAYRNLKRGQERCTKLIVEKFSRFIYYCFSRINLKLVCGVNGQLKPTQEQMDDAMMPLYNYLNSNLQILAEYLTKELLLKVMLAAWSVVISSADQLLLPKLSSAKTFGLSSSTSSGSNTQSAGWHSAVSSAVANVTNSMGLIGFGKSLTTNELETVFSWLNFLCFDFFHNDGNGPPVEELKNEQYQALLLLPVHYDSDSESLFQEVERLSPAFVKSLRDKNNFDNESSHEFKQTGNRKLTRAGSIVRTKTITANATSKLRAMAAEEMKASKSDPVAAQTLAEDIILRLLILRGERQFVAKRLQQRERLAHSIATERLARAAVEGKFLGY